MSSEPDLLVLLDKVRSAVRKRGARTIIGLGRTFRALDSFDGNNKVDAQEFAVGLRENGVELTQKEADCLMSFFDKNGDGHIDFDEFLVGIRGTLTDRRREVVERAFEKFDRDGSGHITIEDLQGVYNVEMHPRYQNGEMTEDEIFEEFLQSFGDKNKDAQISHAEWIEYYSAVSASIDNDDHFILLMKTAWKLE